MRPANDLDYLPSNAKATMRKEIVRLMAVRASLTARSHTDEWVKVDKQIRELQTKIDKL